LSAVGFGGVGGAYGGQYSADAEVCGGGAVVTSAADYYRRAERDTEEYRRKNVDRAQELVGRVPDSVSSTAGLSR
jgi:hypothetical protein